MPLGKNFAFVGLIISCCHSRLGQLNAMCVVACHRRSRNIEAKGRLWTAQQRQSRSLHRIARKTIGTIENFVSHSDTVCEPEFERLLAPGVASIPPYQMQRRVVVVNAKLLFLMIVRCREVCKIGAVFYIKRPATTQCRPSRRPSEDAMQQDALYSDWRIR
jgi:hypothetical protein